MDYNSKALRPGSILTGVTTYRIERVLGAGGFGITYLASMELTVGSMKVKAFVAIKEHFLSSQCERGSDTTSVVCPGTQDSKAIVANSLKDFIAEARRLSDFGKGHPNIVKVNEIFEANDTAYYVMEYLEGQSLSDYISANGALDEQSIRNLVYPIVDAVAYLHDKRVTHLDIKPGNIMLAANADGTVRPVLIDFGLSKHYNADGSATSTVNTMACSDGFAPLEQYKGIRTFSPAADVYALGATLYTAATGHNPATAGEFAYGEPAATIAALPVREQLRTAMTRAMADRAAERYPDAGTLLGALGVSTARTGGVATAPISRPNETRPLAAPATLSSSEPAPHSGRKGMIIGAAIAAVVIIAAIFGFILSRGSEPSQNLDPVVGDTLIAEVIEPIAEPSAEPTQPAAPTPEEIAAAERQEQEAAAERERQRQEAEESERMRQYTTPHNLDLAVRRNGITYYFNQNNWLSLFKQGDEKIGVVIIGRGERFIIAMEDYNGGQELSWYEAMNIYGNQLPTLEEGVAWAGYDGMRWNAVRDAVRAYGGSHTDMNSLGQEGYAVSYWTAQEVDSLVACAFNTRGMTICSEKTVKGKARKVIPLP